MTGNGSKPQTPHRKQPNGHHSQRSPDPPPTTRKRTRWGQSASSSPSSSWRTKGIVAISLLLCLTSLAFEHKRLLSNPLSLEYSSDAPRRLVTESPMLAHEKLKARLLEEDNRTINEEKEQAESAISEAKAHEHAVQEMNTDTRKEQDGPSTVDDNSSSDLLERSQNTTQIQKSQPLSTRNEKLQVYWINLEQSTDRRKDMEENFAMFPDQIDAHRIQATGIAVVRNMWLSHKLELAESKLVFPNQEENYLKHFRGEYVYQEAACLVSHLSMIRAAYEAGHELALFVEDDAVITEDFLKYHDDYVAVAPPGWRILQWTTINTVVYRQGPNLKDPWIGWQPTHWSNVGYTLNREGMENIMKNAHAGNLITDGSNIWNIAEKRMVLADEAIFYLSEAPFTSTFPWIGLRKANTTIQQAEAGSKSGLVEFVNHNDLDNVVAKRMPKRRSEKIIVVTNTRVKLLKQLPVELTRFREEIEALQYWHDDATWIIDVVVIKPEQLSTAKKVCDQFAQNIQGDIRIQVHLITGTYNKFRFLKPVLELLPEYDYVLVKDSDQRMSGFPWNTFMEEKGEAIVSGPLRETIDDSLFRNHLNPHRRGIQFHYGRNWKTRPDSWESQMYSDIVPLSVPWVEMYFTLFRTDFAAWFFDKVLSDWFVENPSDFALDLMWCSAAFEFDSSKPSCYLLPVISSHEDSRQIKLDNGLKAQHREVYSYFDQLNSTTNWLKKSHPWHFLIGSWNQDAPKVAKTCGLQYGKPIPDLLQCAAKVQRAFHEQKKREALVENANQNDENSSGTTPAAADGTAGATPDKE